MVKLNGNNQLKKIKSFYSNIAKDYDTLYSSKLCEIEDSILLSRIGRLLGNSILDLGCGTGLLYGFLSPEQRKKYVGIDISDEMISVAKEKYPEGSFRCGDMHDLRFPEESFDSIVSLYGSFSYSLKPDVIIEQLTKLLKPSGYIILMPYNQRVKEKKYLGRFSTVQKEDFEKKYYNKKAISKLLIPKFTNINVHGINYLGNVMEKLIPPISVFRKIVRKLRLPELFMKIDWFAGSLLSKIIPSLPSYARHMLVIAQKK